MGQIKDQMKGELHVRKSELAKANTLIDWDAEARWQNFEKSAKRCRHGSLAKSSIVISFSVQDVQEHQVLRSSSRPPIHTLADYRGQFIQDMNQLLCYCIQHYPTLFYINFI